VKAKSVRTGIDIPRDLHRRLHEAAACRHCSARLLILNGIERVVEEPVAQRPRRRLNLDKPIVPSRGKPVNLTNAQIHELLELP
jgi:hypothetical protein